MAFSAWRLVSDQMRVGMAGVVGFDMGAAVQVLQTVSLATPTVVLRVRVFADAALAGLRKKGES